jgi:hypothetical protein
MRRGPKIKTAANSAGRGFIRGEVKPTSELEPAALAEFHRLCGVLKSKGTLERVDVRVICEAARCKSELDKAYASKPGSGDLMAEKFRLSQISQLTAQTRGLLRELGLTLQPGRSVYSVNRPTLASDLGDWDDLSGVG